MNSHPLHLSSRVTVLYFLEHVFNIIFVYFFFLLTASPATTKYSYPTVQYLWKNYQFLPNKKRQKTPRDTSPLKASINM